jgi:aminopeptidase
MLNEHDTSAQFRERVARCARHLRDVLRLVMLHAAPRRAIVLHDRRSELGCVVTAAYLECLPEALYLDFDEHDEASIVAAFAVLSEGDLVVLVQADSFRLPAYRIRVELYKRNIKVVAHANLSRMIHVELDRYLDALAYDPAYYRGVGAALKARIDSAPNARVETGASCMLHYAGPLESAKLNTGDFTGLANMGSQFPIGEVFTEPQELAYVHGALQIYGFADTVGRLHVPEAPLTLHIEQGRIARTESSCAEFEAVRARIVEDEGEVWIRELGFGMNRAFSKERSVVDVGAFERACGIHVSVGAKHGVFKKPHLKHRLARHHVDVFAETTRVWLGETLVFEHGAWVVSPEPGRS